MKQKPKRGGTSVPIRTALMHLYGIGEACKRCGWKPNDLIWCSEEHEIRVKHLLALKPLLDP